VLVAALAAPAAHAGDGLVVGVSEDMMKWSPTRPAVVRGHMARLGIGAVRVTLRWSPGETSPRGSTMVALRRAQDTARGRRLVLAVYSKARKAPQIARRRQEYCSYVASLLALAPRVNDVVIWNEPNSNRFWQPQFEDRIWSSWFAEWLHGK